MKIQIKTFRDTHNNDKRDLGIDKANEFLRTLRETDVIDVKYHYCYGGYDKIVVVYRIL